ncbi:hypothetical protein AAG906_009211 [Vitis piasezkii]
MGGTRREEKIKEMQDLLLVLQKPFSCLLEITEMGIKGVNKLKMLNHVLSAPLSIEEMIYIEQWDKVQEEYTNK